jgi:hypothetical protein
MRIFTHFFSSHQERRNGKLLWLQQYNNATLSKELSLVLAVNLLDHPVLAIHVIAIRVPAGAACMEHLIIPSGA